MATRSTKVTVRNRTNFSLTRLNDHLDGGIWTEPLRPPEVIPPGATMWWKSESDGVATGTEGRAAYAVGDSGSTVTWHWNNPFAGMNTYEQEIGPGFGISFSGGLGNDAEPTYTVASDIPVVVPDFLPSRNALQFRNKFPSSELLRIVMPDPYSDISIGDAADGLCGGMSFVTADFYRQGLRAPRDRVVPAPGSPMFVTLVGRLFNSFDIPDGVLEFLKLMNPIYGDSDNLIDNGRAWYMAHVQWPRIQSSIDGGHPCPINLVMVKSILPTDLGENHQVLIYGYKLSGSSLTLRVYDPNSAELKPDAVTMTLDLSHTDRRIVVHHNVSATKPIYCFFVPPYQPVALANGIPRLPLSLRQFLEAHELDPAAGIAQHMHTRGTPTVRALVGTP